MSRTKTIQIYKFEELSPRAQDRAIAHAIETRYYDGSDNTATLKEFERIFPIRVKNWSYGGHCQGTNYIEWEFTCDDDIAELSGLRLQKYIWNNYRRFLFKGKYYSTPGQWIDGNYHYKFRHSNIILEHSCVLTGYCIDDDILQPVYDFLTKPYKFTTFKNLMQDCLNAWIKSATDDYDGYFDRETIIEDFEANEIEFDEYGREV